MAGGRKSEQMIVEEPSFNQLATPLPSNVVPVVPESEATLRHKSIEKSPEINAMDYNGTKLLAEAMEQEENKGR